MDKKYKIEYEHTVKSYKNLNSKDLPLYTKKYDGEWLYRLRLMQGRLVADRLVISPFYELKETLIENVLSNDNVSSSIDEWRLNLDKLMKYFRENE